MIRWLLAIMLVGQVAAAQVRIDPQTASVRDGWWQLEVALTLSDVTPYRAFTLDDPRRLVVDFQNLDFAGLTTTDMLSGDRASDVRFGPLRPGWARMVVDLAQPLVITEAGMTVNDNGANLLIVLKKASPDEFREAAGAPPDPGWEATLTLDPGRVEGIAASGDFVVVIDPGHGGIDPGAIQGGVKEADLMLALASEVAERLNAEAGITAVLTRQADVFVPLTTRLTIARQVGADLFLSLHADALAEDEAQGASVYTLARDGGDAAARRLVERHERGDLLAGVDLDATEDRVATALIGFARSRTGPEGRRFAEGLIARMAENDVRLNVRPARQGQFAVLTAADFPAVLIEAGFLSNAQDRAVLATPQGKARIAESIRQAVLELRDRVGAR